MERGDTGLGRDAYGRPRRRRLGDRRAYRPDDGAGPGQAADDYGQLLRRPGDLPPQQGVQQPGRSRMRPPPRRFPPPPANPADGYPPNGVPGGDPMNGGPAYGGPVPGRQYRLPNGRRVPPRADRPYRPQTPGPAGDMGGPWDQPGPGQGPGPPGQEPLGGGWGRPPRFRAPGGPPRPEPDPRAYSHPADSPGMPGAPGFTGGTGFAGGSAGSRPDGRDGWGRLGAQVPRGVPAGTAGPVIRQRENAVPEEQPAAAAQPAVSIAPDGLESFARDLRALRAKAELDYPELADVSHYTMKTLVSAAGGLRLPTLPVAVAYVRACGGNVAEWEERWQKLAARSPPTPRRSTATTTATNARLSWSPPTRRADRNCPPRPRSRIPLPSPARCTSSPPPSHVSPVGERLGHWRG